MQFSVLMSVYYKEKPEFLESCIKSLLEQTVVPSQIVLVLDGTLTNELQQVVDDFAAKQPELFTVVPLKENGGIGRAAAIGLEHCKFDLVAKMDSDDLCRPDRFEKQLEEFKKDKDLALLGAYLAEFMGESSNIVAVRSVPLTMPQILKYARRRDPFNNSTVMYKKQAVLESGSYGDLRRCEDYDLFVRMLHKGFKAKNLKETLVYYRLSQDTYSRRGSWQNLNDFLKVHWKIYKLGFCSLIDFIIPCCGQIVLSIIPRKMKDLFYKKLLRK